MRTIAHKGGGGLILAIFVRKYYVDDPYVYIFYAFLNNKKKFTVWLFLLSEIPGNL